MQGCTIVPNYVVELTMEKLPELLHELVYILWTLGVLNPPKVLRGLSSQSALSTDAQDAQAPRMAHPLSTLPDAASVPLRWLGGATCLTGFSTRNIRIEGLWR
jgi:hypothetical protein